MVFFGAGVGADSAPIEVVEGGGAPGLEPLGARVGRVAPDAADEQQRDQASQGKTNQASGQPLVGPLAGPLFSLQLVAPGALGMLPAGLRSDGWSLHGGSAEAAKLGAVAAVAVEGNPQGQALAPGLLPADLHHLAVAGLARFAKAQHTALARVRTEGPAHQ